MLIARNILPFLDGVSFNIELRTNSINSGFENANFLVRLDKSKEVVIIML